MKKLILILAFVASVSFAETTIAQVSLSVNIGSQPIWGPTGYDHVEYYYLPDIEVYYNVSSRRYIYMEQNHWVSRAYLPRQYSNYDLYHTRRIVVNEYKPYLNHHNNRSKYSNWHDDSNRESIRDSRNPRYYESRYHPHHSQYKEYRRNEQMNSDNNSRQAYQNGNQGNYNKNERNQGNQGNNKNKGNQGNQGNNGHGKNKKH